MLTPATGNSRVQNLVMSYGKLHAFQWDKACIHQTLPFFCGSGSGFQLSTLLRSQYLPALSSRMQCSCEVRNTRQIPSTGDFLPSCHVMCTDNWTHTTTWVKLRVPGPMRLERNRNRSLMERFIWSCTVDVDSLVLVGANKRNWNS